MFNLHAMKKFLALIIGLTFFGSCSAPKMAGSNPSKPETNVATAGEPSGTFSYDQATLVASASGEHFYEASRSVEYETPMAAPARPALTKAEKKELKKEALRQVKAYAKAVKDGDTEKAEELKKGMDNDLKFAAIFGSIGLVSFIIGGDVFNIIGAVAMIIGIVFFVKWLLRQ